MKKKEQDRALQVPAEANREKHINFLEEEEKAAGTAGKDSHEFQKRMKNPIKSKKDSSSS